MLRQNDPLVGASLYENIHVKTNYRPRSVFSKIMTKSKSRKYVILGGGGHGQVVLSIARELNITIAGVCDPLLAQSNITKWHGIKVLGDDAVLSDFSTLEFGLINGVGSSNKNRSRLKLQKYWEKKGFEFEPLVHPRAWVAPCVDLAMGVQVMAGAIVQPGCVLGEGSIINTGATVDHDCNIGAYSHVAPGTTICGNVTIGSETFVGAGAIIVNGVIIADLSFVKAGSVIKNDFGNSRLASPDTI